MGQKKIFTTKEVITKAGISRNTLFLWLKKEKVPEVYRDRNGHRIFTNKDIKNVIRYKNKTIPPSNGRGILL